MIKTLQQIKAGYNLDAILHESLMHLITSKLDQNIINKLCQKLDQKRINISKMDAIICNIKWFFNASNYISVGLKYYSQTRSIVGY